MSDIGAMIARAVMFYIVVVAIVAFGLGALVFWGLYTLLT